VDSGGQKADGNAGSKVLLEGLDGDQDSIENCTTDHLFYNLAKNMPTFCPFPETVREAEFVGGELVHLMEEESRQCSILAVVWILMAALSHKYMRIRSKSQRKCVFWPGKRQV
jgi:hypothetical protein